MTVTERPISLRTLGRVLGAVPRTRRREMNNSAGQGQRRNQMAHQFALSQPRCADGALLSDAQLGMLLDALQLGTSMTTQPARFRDVLALLARHS